jgi:hypothetical protein
MLLFQSPIENEMEKERIRGTMNLFSGNKTEATKMLAIYF